MKHTFLQRRRPRCRPRRSLAEHLRGSQRTWPMAVPRGSRTESGNRRFPFRSGLALCALLTLGSVAFASEKLAIQGATVIHADGTEVANATILIENGIIQAVGESVEVPYDATVIDAEGKTCFPGMVLAHTSSGVDRSNENVSVTPYVSVYDSLDPSSLFFEQSHCVPGLRRFT